MILQLNVRNYLLIRDLKISFSPGLNVITGETGAGKTILLDTLHLLMGRHARYDIFADSQEKCVIEGDFDLSSYDIKSFFQDHDLSYEDHTILRREIFPQGRARAFVNDTPVSLDVLKGLSSHLLDIHSQHENLLLTSHAFQRDLVDAYADNFSLRETYQLGYADWENKRKAYEELLTVSQRGKEEEEYHRFLYEELVKMGVSDADQSKLEDQVSLLTGALEVKEGLQEVLQSIRGDDTAEHGILSRLWRGQKQIQSLAAQNALFQEEAKRLEGICIELDDIIKSIAHKESNLREDKEEAARLRERLDSLYSLMRKHKVKTVAELQEKQTSLEKSLGQVEDHAQKLAVLKPELDKLQHTLSQHAERLSQRRRESLSPLRGSILEQVRPLGMEDALLKITHADQPLDRWGKDRIDILFTAHKDLSFQPLSKVASGGELSRLMLVFKYMIAQHRYFPTLLFDEIETGLSGEIALRMAKMMRDMALRHQVITISHLPIFAVQADKHFRVAKEQHDSQTRTTMVVLEGEERILEIAKMIGGDHPPPEALEHARTLLEDREGRI
ncbi:MAG: DNA repair protein RecN [Cytophagales bacterium]|nr:DNA repair protein RecN [Cytophagales bacterium]